MKRKEEFIESTKKELVNSLLESKLICYVKYITVGFLTIYLVGHAFNILTFTNNNFNKFKKSLN